VGSGVQFFQSPFLGVTIWMSLNHSVVSAADLSKEEETPEDDDEESDAEDESLEEDAFLDEDSAFFRRNRSSAGPTGTLNASSSLMQADAVCLSLWST
jgi:hypothetical protein